MGSKPVLIKCKTSFYRNCFWPWLPVDLVAAATLGAGLGNEFNMAEKEVEKSADDENGELPPGWETRYMADRRIYYVDHNTKTTQWHHPKNGLVKTVIGELPYGWYQETDEEGCVFYVNSIKGQTTYFDPRIALAANPRKKKGIRIDTSKTALDVLKDKNLDGKVVIVTGANTGIGFETAKALSLYGAHVIMACRDMDKGNSAAEKIRGIRKTLLPKVSVLHLDLASLESIETFEQHFKAMDLPLHILICNAAVLASSWDETKDGIEQMFGVNHVGHFYLVKLLEDCLRKSAPARVVVVTSESHRFPNFDYTDQLDLEQLPSQKDQFWSILAYNRSKLCNLLFSMELNRRLIPHGVTCNAVHPGNMIYTSLGTNSWLYWFMFVLCRPFAKSAPQGAAGVVHCATSTELDSAGGYYFNNFYAIEPSKEACNTEKAVKLWTMTEKLINEKKQRYKYSIY